VRGGCGAGLALWRTALAAGLLASLLGIGFVTCAWAEEPKAGMALRRFVRRERHMGTEFVITAYGEQADQVDSALDAAFARIGELDRKLSNYRSDSELSRLSHSSPHTTMMPVSEDLWQVLRAADEVSRKTEGAFDVTVGPLSKLWRHARRVGEWPSQQRWQQAHAAVSFTQIKYDASSRSVRLTRPGALLDLGGIAKGYALDEALKVLRQCGVARALVVGGGDIAAGDAPPGQPGWRIGVAGLGADAQPDDELDVQRWLRLANLAVATSGDRWQFIQIDGRRYSHLIDPRSGQALKRRSSVTVIAPNGMQADAWASAFSVLQVDAASALLPTLRSIEAQIIQQSDDGVARHETPGFARYDAD
jgi:thiamine biosynthesis lipoprotein